MEFRFFQKFSDVRTFTNHPLPRPGMSEISKPPPPHLPDALCRRPLRFLFHSIRLDELVILMYSFVKIGCQSGAGLFWAIRFFRPQACVAFLHVQNAIQNVSGRRGRNFELMFLCKLSQNLHFCVNCLKIYIFVTLFNCDTIRPLFDSK